MSVRITNQTHNAVVFVYIVLPLLEGVVVNLLARLFNWSNLWHGIGLVVAGVLTAINSDRLLILYGFATEDTAEAEK